MDEVKLPLEPLRFTALTEFKDGLSEYVPGLSYTVKPGNETLLEKVMHWYNAGMVHLGQVGKAKLTGTLKVG